MSYQVVARKWRPQRFDEVIGQDHITTTLKFAITADRIAPVYLFTGIRGTGKTTLARIMVKTLNCLNPHDNGEPCNTCENCIEIMAGKSPDVIEIDGASNNSVDDVRNIKENITYSPVKSKYKVYIIDEVHMLSKSAFNALLKTLEEPPSYVIFILATTDPQKIPTTVLSRCQRYDLKRLSMDDVVNQMGKILESENLTYERNALYQIAREGEGSMRDSQTVLEQLITFGEGKITEEAVTSVLGNSDKEHLRGIVEAIAARNSKKAIALVHEIFLSGKSIEKAAKDILHLLHHIVLYSELKDASFIDISQEERTWIQKVSELADPTDWIRIFSFWNKEYEQIKMSDFSLMIFEVTTISACRFPKMADFSDFVSLLKNGVDTITVPDQIANNISQQRAATPDTTPEITEENPSEPSPELPPEPQKDSSFTPAEESEPSSPPSPESIEASLEPEPPSKTNNLSDEIENIQEAAPQEMEYSTRVVEEIKDHNDNIEIQNAAEQNIPVVEREVPIENDDAAYPEFHNEDQPNDHDDSDENSKNYSWEGYIAQTKRNDTFLYGAVHNLPYEETSSHIRLYINSNLQKSLEQIIVALKDSFKSYFGDKRVMEIEWKASSELSVADKELLKREEEIALIKEEISDDKSIKELEEIGFELKKIVVK